MKCNPIPEREDWFICDRKPIICPRCGKKEVRPSMFGMPSPEVWESGKWHIAGCMPDFPEHRTWGCRNCDAAFWKDTKHNLGRLHGVVHRDKEGKLRLVASQRSNCALGVAKTKNELNCCFQCVLF
tara:strand:+ start:565 stop:942 length:378 start_codon:yes stop_codon:yes gene_type:complete